MALTHTATSELEAVNVMLGAIAESPVSSLDSLTTLSASTARSMLHEISRAVQSKGWHFNSEDAYPLVRNTDGEITLAPDILSVDLDTYRYPSIDVVQRGFRLYDKVNHTYNFDTDLVADIVSFLPFDQLPEPHRRYITIKAARTFVDRMVGDQAHHTFSKDDENGAKAELMSLESDVADYNFKDDPEYRRVVTRNR